MTLKILYVKKKTKHKKWSNVLERQFFDLERLAHGNVQLYEVDTQSLLIYITNIFKILILLNKQNFDIIYINHIICAYPFVPLKVFYRKRMILALHETEPVLGFRFAIKNFKDLSWKEFLRYSFMYKLPLYFFKEILVLNKRQIPQNKSKRKYHQMNYLGINLEAFKKKGNVKFYEELKIFFPNDHSRPEKGYVFIEEALKDLNLKFVIRTGGGYEYNEMKEIYQESDIVILTSIYETYSLSLLESMASNTLVVASNQLGLIINLLEKYTPKELESFGLFVTDLKKKSIINAINKVVYNIENRIVSRTRELLSHEGLDEKSVNGKLYNYFLEKAV